MVAFKKLIDSWRHNLLLPHQHLVGSRQDAIRVHVGCHLHPLEREVPLHLDEHLDEQDPLPLHLQVDHEVEGEELPHLLLPLLLLVRI